MALGVAVSGGADSVYLLLEMLAAGERCIVLHVNHGLRGAESDGDEVFVRELSGRLGVECLVLREGVGQGNLEQGARRVRYGWFRELMERGVVERVAMGHTLSDQAETVLFRILRGAGTAGLAGIRAQREDGFFRPLLGLQREEIRERLRAAGMEWREDSSNESREFARNRIRRELLPQLEREWNPELTRSLAQMAEWAAAEESYWAGRMKKLAAKYFQADGVVSFPARLPVAVERRLIRHAIETIKGNLRQIEYGHVEAVRGLRSGKLSLPGVTVEKSFGAIRFSVQPTEQGDISDGMGLELLQPGSVYNVGKDQLDWGKLTHPLKLRNWRAGDKYRRVGRPKEERLKLLFQKARVRVWDRRCWPVLEGGDGIIWSRGFGAAAGAERTESTQLVLQVRDSPVFRI